MTKNTQNTKFIELERGEINIDEVTVSENFRKEFKEEQLKELAANIAKVGVLEPIILRQNRNYKILVAGERRLRAAQMAGLQTIPYRLLDLTEEQAQEVTVLENLHRADLNPIEEARGFKALLERGGYEVQDVAERVDKSKAYVYRSLRLLDLPEEAQKALLNGEITTGHARHLLCVPADQVKDLLKEIKRRKMTAANLKEQIKWSYGADLERAGWELEKEYAGKTACSKCPYNTANQQSLFDEAVEAGRCTNRGCYEAKESQYAADFVEQVKAKAEKLGMEFLEPTQCWNYDDDFEELDEETQEKYAEEIKKHPEKFALTVPVGENYEMMFCTDKKLARKINEEKYHFDDDDDDTEETSEERAARELEQAIQQKEEELVAEKLLDELRDWELTEEEFSQGFDFDDWQAKLLAKFFGVENLTLAELSKLTAKELARALHLLNKLGKWNFSEDIAEITGHTITDEEVEQIHEQAVAALNKENK